MTTALDELVSVREAARRLRVSPRTVRRWLLEGKLTGTHADDGWTIPASQLETPPMVKASSAHIDVLLGHRSSPVQGQEQDDVLLELRTITAELRGLRLDLATMGAMKSLEPAKGGHWLSRL